MSGVEHSGVSPRIRRADVHLTTGTPMKQISFFCRAALGLVICLALTAPCYASESMETLQKKLDDFAMSNAKTINACILPSKNKKEVSKNPDGSWTARYIEVDLASINTTVKKSDNPNSIMKYSGSLRYQEVEWVCTAASKAAAEKGPFEAKRRELITEPVIKYLNGRCTN